MPMWCKGIDASLTAALNWYRAMPLADMRDWTHNLVTAVPTMFVWSDDDRTIMASGARTCGNYVTSEYRFEMLHGVSHWVLDEASDAVADLLLDWFATHPPAPRGARQAID